MKDSSSLPKLPSATSLEPDKLRPDTRQGSSRFRRNARPALYMSPMAHGPINFVTNCSKTTYNSHFKNEIKLKETLTLLFHCKEITVFLFFYAQISIKHHLQNKQLHLSRLKVTHAVIRLIQGGLHNRYSSCQHQVTTSIQRQQICVCPHVCKWTEITWVCSARLSHTGIRLRDVRVTCCRLPLASPQAQFRGLCACLPGPATPVSASLAPGTGWLY